MTAAEVARALAAHPRWWWRAPILLTDGWRVTSDGLDPEEWPDAVPDLAEDATAGVLLGMLPGEWHVARMESTGSFLVLPDRAPLFVVRHRGADYLGATLGEAAGRAVLAVWGPA